MKKLLVLLLIVAAAISCSKSEEKKESLDDRLVGTKWQTRDIACEVIYGGTCYEVFEFINTYQVEDYTIRGGSVISTSGTYVYELDYPHITISQKNADGGYVPVKYTFTDTRTMLKDGVSPSTYYAKWIRQ